MMIAHSNICWRLFNTSLFLWMAANRKVNYLEAQFRERHHRMLLKKERASDGLSSFFKW
jgi:hypothetical protein